MRALAEQAERGDVIVTLDVAFMLDPGMAACVTWMASVPGARYVRVSARPHLREADAIAMLAHERQHVVEVIDNPEVRPGADLAALYERIGHRTGGGGRTWDTVAALRAGDLTRTELVRGTSCPLDPPRRPRGYGRNVAMPSSGWRVMSGTCASTAG